MLQCCVQSAAGRVISAWGIVTVVSATWNRIRSQLWLQMRLVWQRSVTSKEMLYSMNQHMADVTSHRYKIHFTGLMTSARHITLGWRHSASFCIWCASLLVSHCVDITTHQCCWMVHFDALCGPSNWRIGPIDFLALWRNRPLNQSLVSLCLALLFNLVVIYMCLFGQLCYNLIVV